MNYKLLCRIFAILLFILAVAMGGCLAYALTSEETTGELPRWDGVYALSASIIFYAALGLFLLIKWGRHATGDILRKDAIAIVGLGWVICSIVGALPFMLCEPGLPLVPALFESTSGFSTTGATVIGNLIDYPRSVLLWRSLTQWLGGMGILVLFVALLSYLGVGSKALFHHESSARSAGGLQARIHDVAVRIWQIYMFLSLICTLGLVWLGMSWYDAITHTFTTISTAGFSPYDQSVGYFQSGAIEIWITTFMILGSLSFMLFGWLIRENPEPFRLIVTALGTVAMTIGVFLPRENFWGHLLVYVGLLSIILIWTIRVRAQHWKEDEESKVFVGVVVAGLVIVTVDRFALDPTLWHGEHQWTTALNHLIDHARTALFQVVSVVTTTGFSTDDFDKWPQFSRIMLFILMAVGGCAGSTAASIKVSRWLLFFKTIKHEVTAAFRPNQVMALHLNGSPTDERLRAQTIFFIAMSGVFVIFGTAFVSLMDPLMDLETSLSASIATLFNVGPGFSQIGPVENFGELSSPSLLLLCVWMLLGRLEFFAILVLFSPMLWRKY